MIKYSEALSETLKKDKTSLKMYGVDIQTKCIPDEPRKGYMDPRQLELNKQEANLFANDAKNQQKQDGIEEIRKKMGFPNLNMNTVEIHTKYEEHNFDGNVVKIWIYYPRKPEGKIIRPGFIFIHGGAWIGGTPFTVENPCRLLAERADCVVFNLDYSLAPEKPYPNGLNDCFNTLKYIYANAERFGVDKNKIGIGGDSAGGNISAVCALKDKELGTGMLKYQALIYPVVTVITSDTGDYKWRIEDYDICDEQKAIIDASLSLGRPRRGSVLDEMAIPYLQHGEDPSNPYISPLLAHTHNGLCKALIAVAEYDGLRIQGEIYGEKLKEAGVVTRVIRYKGVNHAFFDKLGVFPQAEDLVQEIANDLRSLN
jgi:acetyl esterase